MMFSFMSTRLSEIGRTLSRNVSLVYHLSCRSYTLCREVRHDPLAGTIDARRFEERLKSLRKSIDNSFAK
jgi:hypothetical protein